MPERKKTNDSLVLRVPPKDENAEQRLLAALMLDGSCLQKVNEAVGRLKEEDFYSEKNRLIFSAILRRSECSDNFDPTLVKATVENNGLLDKAGGPGYLAQLLQGGGSPSSAPDYALVVRECCRRRQLIALGEKIADSGYAPDGRDVRTLYSQAQSIVYDAVTANDSEVSEGPRPIVEVSKALIERIHANLASGTKMRGVPSGFSELDQLTLGLQGGTLNIIAARPGVGKTSFAMNIVENIVLNPDVKKPGLVFSMEMPAEAIAMRMLSNFGQVPLQKLTNGGAEASQWERIITKLMLLTGKRENEDHEEEMYNKLYIDDTGNISPAELRSRAHQIADREGGVSVIMIDYIQLMKGDTDQENRALELGGISRSLKLLSKELDCPVLCLSQLNREVDSRKDHRPMNSDLRESGSIEQDADLILFLHRESLYREKTDEHGDDGQATLIVGKNRNGALKDIELQFIGEYTSFYDKAQPVGEVPLPLEE